MPIVYDNSVAAANQAVVWAFPSTPITGDRLPWIQVPFNHTLISAFVTAKTPGTTSSTINIYYATQASVSGSPSWTSVFTNPLRLDANERSSTTASTAYSFNGSLITRNANDFYKCEITTVGTGLLDVVVNLVFGVLP